jgi:hypothetical protein
MAGAMTALATSLLFMQDSLTAQSWTQLTAGTSTPSARIFPTLAYDATRDNVLLFGGMTGSGTANDTWTWSPATGTWSQASPTNSPSARQVMAFTYDAGRSRVVMWGGLDTSFLSDTWEWDGTNWANRGNSPFAGRCGAAMVYDNVRQRTILFGGQGQSTFENDVWEWNGTSWTQTFANTTSSSAPAPRFHHGMVFDSMARRVIAFGGANGATSYGDTWAWSTETSTWTRISTTGPTARSQGGMFYDDRLNRTFLYGGEATNGQSLGDTWILSGNTWSLATDSPPSARRKHAMAYRSNAGRTLMFGGQQAGLLNQTWDCNTSANAIVNPMSIQSLATTGAPAGFREHAIAPLPGGGLMLFGGTTANGPLATTYTLQGTTFTPEYPKFSPQLRTEHTLLLDPIRQNNILFGGKNPAGIPLSATWIWSAGQWQMMPVTNGPSARSGHRMSFDPIANVALLFGGENGTGAALGDFWSWDGTNWTSITPGTLPPARGRHGMAFDAFRNKTIVHGGRNGANRLSDVWEWDGTRWVEANAGFRPTERHGSIMTFDTGSNRAVVFGGRDNGGFFSETWELTSSSGPLNAGLSWSNLSPTVIPTARNSAASVYDSARGVSLMFGGYDGANALGETWTFDTATTTWLRRPSTANPSPRSSPGMCFDSVRARAVLFGGANFQTGNSQETWEWNGTAWSLVNTATTPPARTYHKLAYDSARQRTVLFGGQSTPTVDLDDTWEYNGTTWTNVTPSGAKPSPRRGLMMCYDSIRNETVLFGGQDASGARADTWTWNGTSWTLKNPTNSPPARLQGSMVFDPNRGRIVLFGGGSTDWTTNFSDTWEWNGTNWSPASFRRADGVWNPGARDGHSMAYDPKSERVLLHGGQDSSGALGDTWSWNGRDWAIHQKQVGESPAPRIGSQLVHESGSNKFLLIGGGRDAFYSNEIWEITLPTYARATLFGQPCVGTGGPLGLAVVNNSLPVIGTTFQMQVTNVPAFSPSIGWYGTSNTTINGLPLPLNLDPIQIFGCFAYMDAAFNMSLGLPGTSTRTTPWNISIPLNPELLSVHVYFQALVLEFGGTRRGTMSNAIDAKIGDR